jgi:hypothetical protein
MLAQAACVLGMALFGATGVWLIAILYGAQGAANALWPPALQRWLYAVTPSGQWPSANAAIGSVNGVMTIIGAALGGVLTAWSTAGALAVAAAVQAASLISLLGVTPPRSSTATPPVRRLRTDIADAMSALRVLPLARSVIWIGIAWGFIGGAYNVMLAAFVTRELHGGGPLLGAFYVVDGLAVIAGSALAARLRANWHLPSYAMAYTIQGAAWGLMFVPRQAAAGFVLLAIMRVASGVIIALDFTILLATVPERLRGRVTSLHMTTYNTVSGISLGAFGGIIAAVGLTAVGVATGVASMLFGGAWWFVDGRHSRDLYADAGDSRAEEPTPEGRP